MPRLQRLPRRQPALFVDSERVPSFLLLRMQTILIVLWTTKIHNRKRCRILAACRRFPGESRSSMTQRLRPKSGQGPPGQLWRHMTAAKPFRHDGDIKRSYTVCLGLAPSPEVSVLPKRARTKDPLCNLLEDRFSSKPA